MLQEESKEQSRDRQSEPYRLHKRFELHSKTIEKSHWRILSQGWYDWISTYKPEASLRTRGNLEQQAYWSTNMEHILFARH